MVNDFILIFDLLYDIRNFKFHYQLHFQLQNSTKNKFSFTMIPLDCKIKQITRDNSYSAYFKILSNSIDNFFLFLIAKYKLRLLVTQWKVCCVVFIIRFVSRFVVKPIKQHIIFH